jgi:hypothetical protein
MLRHLYKTFCLGLEEASQLLQGLQESLSLSPVALYFEGLLFRCKVRTPQFIFDIE